MGCAPSRRERLAILIGVRGHPICKAVKPLVITVEVGLDD